MSPRRAAAARRETPTIDPDGDVLALVRKDDLRAATELLMLRHGTAVYRFVRSELRDGVLADDVHQHIFIQVFRDLPRFGGVSTLRVWVFAIARNRVLDAASSAVAACITSARRPTRTSPIPDPRPTNRSMTPGFAWSCTRVSRSSAPRRGPL